MDCHHAAICRVGQALELPGCVRHGRRQQVRGADMRYWSAAVHHGSTTPYGDVCPPRCTSYGSRLRRSMAPLPKALSLPSRWTMRW